jgi:protein associated with RNAse G/E
MIRDNGVSYYCNLASPFVLDKEALKYVDYDLDVKVFPNGEKRLLDTDEYELHKAHWRYPADIDYIVREHVKILVDWIDNQQGPFSDAYIDLWYRRYLEIKRRNSQQ